MGRGRGTAGRRARPHLDLNGWINPPGLPGANGWQLRAGDRFLAADLDGDGQAELTMVSPGGQWVGVVEQQAGALVLTSILNGWINPPGLPGANGWQLRAGDGSWPRTSTVTARRN